MSEKMVSEFKFVVQSAGDCSVGIQPYFNIVTVSLEYEEFEENMEDFGLTMIQVLQDQFDASVMPFEQFEKARLEDEAIIQKLEQEHMEQQNDQK